MNKEDDKVINTVLDRLSKIEDRLGMRAEKSKLTTWFYDLGGAEQWDVYIHYRYHPWANKSELKIYDLDAYDMRSDC